MKKTLAFTLAEVLITLVIIGVVAAITVPTLIANSNDQAIRSALRKNYSVLQQATERYYVDNGEHLSMETNFSEDFFFKYFSLAQNCTISGCNFGEDIKYKNYAGFEMDEYSGITERSGVMLADGTFISYLYQNKYNGEDKYVAVTSKERGLTILVDVNGAKKPNTYGKDLFKFDIILENGDGSSGLSKVRPGGAEGDHQTEEKWCKPGYNHDTNGAGCTAKMLKDKSR